MTEDPQVPLDFAERLREEDARARRLTLSLTWLPVLVGAVVIGVAFWGVHTAERQRDALRREQADLESNIAELQLDRDALTREIEERKRLFASVKQDLPADSRRDASLIERGLDLTKRGEYQQAIDVYDTVLEGDGENGLALHLKGTTSYEAKDYGSAIESLSRTVKIDPNDTSAHYTLSLALAAAGRMDEAIHHSEQAFRLDPALRTRANLDPAFWPIRMRLEARAAEHTAATDLEKQHINAGIAAAQKGRLQEAIDQYDLALQANPANASVLNFRGYALYRLKRHDEARDSLLRAIQADEKHSEAHYNLSLVQWQLNDRAEAARLMERAFTLDPELQKRAQGDVRSRPILRFMGRAG
jgi:tetratricopeptide (TPR) repeat protein